MNKALVFVLVCTSVLTGSLLAKDESFLIRRAYIDTIGVVPTIEEIEWYCVYNTNKSYEVAVDYLINNPKCKINMPKRLLRILLLSPKYRDQNKVPMLREQVLKNLFYVVGMGNETNYNNDNYNKAAALLINNALKYSDDNTIDAIDYMANCLMSRSTNLEEINILVKIYKTSNKSEKESLKDVLNVILTFEDVVKY